jgi:ABC-type amino acid transport substrate-binding protein
VRGRIATLAALLMLAASPAHAQWINLGVKGGIDIATQQITGGSSGAAPQDRIGVVAGVFETLPPLFSWLDVQAEGLYAAKGAKVTVAGITTTEEIDYLEVPILARAKRSVGRWKLYAAAGPAVSFRLRARTRASFSGSTQEIDISNQVEPIDFGIAMGGGVERGRLVIDARYTLGLSDIDKDKTDATKTTNREMVVTVGYRLHR